MIISTRTVSALGALVIACCPLALSHAAEFSDGFNSEKLQKRRAMRGDWSFTDGIARCTQDDALYKKYKDHGPIIFYGLEYSDCEVSYRFKPESCKTVVFTLNGEGGHVFRFVVSAKGLNLRLFPPGGEKKSISGGRSTSIVLRDGEWTEVKVKLQGDTASVKIGDTEPITVTHESLTAPKSNLSIGFSFGTLSIADWKVEYEPIK